MRPRDASRGCLCVSASSKERPGSRSGVRSAAGGERKAWPQSCRRGAERRKRVILSAVRRQKIAHGEQCGVRTERRRVGNARKEQSEEPVSFDPRRPGDPYKTRKDRPCRRDRPQTRSVGPYGGQGSIPHRERVAGTAPGWFFWAAERDRSPHRPCRKHRADSFRPPEAQEKDRFRNSLRGTKANTPSAKHAREKDGPSAGGCRPHGSAPSRRRRPAERREEETAGFRCISGPHRP